MADKGRDFKISILSDADQFDLSKPASELDDLGDKAKQSADKVDNALKDLGEKGLNNLADEAKETARKVDTAFDRIAKSSRSNMRKVDDDADKAAKGLDDLKDEASQSGKEAAASFSGEFSDITDIVQEIGANAFAGFGPVGAAAGIAAAAGIGILVSQMQEAQERIKNVREELRSLGLSADTTQLDKFNSAIETLASNDDLTQLRKSVEQAGVAWDDYLNAVVNGGPGVDAIKDKLRDLGSTGGGLAGVWDDNVQGAQAAYDALDQYRQGAQGAATDIDAVKPKIDELTAAQESQAAAAQKLQAAQDAARGAIANLADSTAGLSSVVQEEAQKQADATKDPSDSWTDYADNVKVSAASIIETLNEQTKAATEFRDNLLVVQKRGDIEFTQWVSQQPPAIAAAYKAGTAKERAGIYAAWKRNVGAAAGDGIAEGMASKKPAARAAASGVHEDMKAELRRRIDVPVGVDGPSRAEINSIRAGIQNALSGITVGVEAIAKTTFRTAP